ncbi:hypothetical protein Desde_3163 [Desulfitobacterium dehalogenans ATCC 51507]|uniref:Glycine-rich domain-containing protein n=1 Tax=Desulfitobacterium dehalogenans (strain ATCC 51507 / DSM 9161 / JW/IU-DC1) TaxID=756499 RepID=I4ABW9_DESDJ|nr:hypothetical protein [Desulfitobacterium dehalogenans]AFM01454.1 hypothetical protein Desde_3163 [Desulfitobacterium dehalogenans ATCC 51507]
MTVSGGFGVSVSRTTNTNGYFNFGITPSVIGGPYTLHYSVTSSSGNYAVSHNTLTVTAPLVIPTDKILEGVSIAGQIGTMPNMATANPNGIGVGRSLAKEYWTGGGSTVFLKPQRGYFDGADTWTYVNAPNLLPSNIKQGVNLFGVTGTYLGTVPTHGSKEWTTPGTYSFTVPEGVNSIFALIQAGGGGGGGNTPGQVGGGGGGGGGYGVFSIPVTPGQILPIVVGSGGLGGTINYYDGSKWTGATAGQDGGNSSVGSYSCTGGKGGSPGGSYPYGGLGGIGNSYGRNGTPGTQGEYYSPSNGLGGAGGMNNYGTGGMGSGTYSTKENGDGNDGSCGRVVVFW